MSKITIVVAASLLAGFAVGAWVMNGNSTAVPQGFANNTDPDANAPMEERMRRLEQIISDEREARLVLEDQLLLLFADLEGLENARDRMQIDRAARSAAVSDAQMQSSGRPRDMAATMRMFQDRRLAQLVRGGFSEDQARRLMQQEAEAQFKAMEAEHLARRNGEAVDAFSSIVNSQAIFRAAIGDEEFERYLTAQEQPTTVQISNVLDGSPGSRTGLQAGDSIVSYNGVRTFSMLDVRELTMQGNAGENVIIEVDRNGVRMQLSIPRGPIGLTGYGAMVRGMSSGWGG
jgi:C-terminal processing protease CtpA/Prc